MIGPENDAIFYRFGRKPTMVGCMLTGGTLGVIAMFAAVNIIIFAILRFFIAACFVGAVLLAHIVSVNMRNFHIELL